MDFIYANLTNILGTNDLQREILELKKELAELKTNIIDTKQDTLESGINIKTINNNSLLAEGDLSITEAKLQQELITRSTIGAIPAGTSYAPGTNLEQIFRDIFGTEGKLYFGTFLSDPAGLTEDYISNYVPNNFTTEAIPDQFKNISYSYSSTSPEYCAFLYPISNNKNINEGNYELAHIYYGTTFHADNIPNEIDFKMQWGTRLIHLADTEFKLYYQLNATLNQQDEYIFEFEKSNSR